MEYRSLGRSGLKVPVLSFGTATFGGEGEFFQAWGSTQVAEARRLIDICLESGLNFFDTANGYSGGKSETILGEVLEGRRNKVLISTKASIPQDASPNGGGSSRHHILNAVHDSLRRLRTDHIDVYHMHIFDAVTPIEETVRVLDDLVESGKVRYLACSNFSGWHLMKSLATADRLGLSRYVGHQAYYSLVGREFESELMTLGKEEGVGTIVWSPLAGGALTGKLRRDKPAPTSSRIGTIDFIPFEKEHLFKVVDALDEVSKECGKSIAQVALNWVLGRPTVCNVVVGARNEEQLRQNLGAVGWKLTDAQIQKLDRASAQRLTYPYWHQRFFPTVNPSILPND